jgi:hypothetical protein
VAPKPDGKSSKTERVTFTRPAADRIAKAVRKVEAGSRDGAPLVFDRVVTQSSPLRLGTFTGTWDINTYKTVTLTGSTQTASVYNWCTPVKGGDTANTSVKRYVIFGRVMGTTSAVEIQLQNTAATCAMSVGGIDLTGLDGYDAGQIQLLGHNSTGPCLQWYSITTCSTAA